MTQSLVLYGFPRSGHNMLRQILWYHFGKKSAFLKGLDPDRVGWQLIWDGTGRDPDCPIRFQHSYPYDALGQKVIYVLRDGRAALVSHSHLLPDFHGWTRSPAALLPALIRGELPITHWASHVATYHRLPYDRRLLVRYEDMCDAIETVIDHLSEFLGWEPKPDGEMPPFATFHAAEPLFFRVGNNQGWRQEWNDELQKLFWDIHGQTMMEYGYEEDWRLA